MTLPSPDPSPLRRVPVRTLGALSASVIVLPLAGGTAEAATIPLPKPDRTLPSALDVAPPYQPGTLCLTENQVGPVAFAKLLDATYGKHVWGVLRKCDQEHGEGRALDWMLNANKASDLALGNAITRWLAAPDAQGRPGAMARRLGVNYLIWNRQQWKAWAPERGWTKYTGSSPHTDHIHISFTWDGAVKRTSWWTGTAVTTYLTGPPSTPQQMSNDPKDYVKVTLRRGSRGKPVEVLQKTIGGLAVDGSFGPATEARVKAYQKSKGLSENGIVDSRVWNALIAAPGTTGPAGSGSSTSSSLAKYAGTVLRRGSRGEAVKALQKAIGKLAVDGSFGPATEARVKAYQKSKGLTQNGVVDSRVWNALMGKKASGSSTTTSPLAKYSGVVLRLHSRGEAVKALQKAVGGLVVDGSFGPKTLARVKTWQKSKGLAVDGVIDAKDWKVLAGGSSAAKTVAPATAAPASSSAVTATEFTPVKGTTLRTGSTGSAVKVLQQALGGLAVDGRYSSATQARVVSFQRAAGLKATGVVDRATWDAVERSAHPLLPYWNTVLRRGSHGAGVVALQKALRITADGSYGPATEAAVKAAQKASHLAQTGVVATLTWKAVEARSR
ncbi:peptidoglycan-binding domain-containing protein [Phycicoccus sonneratiae]|uniref:Peptidoglycan-binding protein n=1 Tax=Phycicoccus sonneratiae TaxID=2807628 RepID=A0ABS2CMG9_9MICO|nr:peptidoglycan-binding protein [Phycicoccus sonneraticus]MBM6400975.1 peptidoglycan-binding protein [Phycicoccus sonneraticus]